MHEERIESDAAVIGVVFPIYGFLRIPLIVERFVKKLGDISSKYVFAVSTYGSVAGMGIKTFGKVVSSNGGRLSAGFAVHMPMNNITIPSFIYSGAIGDKERKLFINWRRKCDFICSYIEARKEGRIEASNRLLFSLFYPIDRFYGRWRIQSKYNKLANANLKMNALWPMMDLSYHYDEECNGCSVCSKICPVNNIKMVDGKPSWQHNCERCLACLQWCPKQAIEFDKESVGRQRYHHPDVRLSDMLMMKDREEIPTL